MALEQAKSSLVTDLDASPPIRHTAGLGAGGAYQYQAGTITPTASADVHSNYTLARLPSNAKVKEVTFNSATQGATGIYDIGAFYATDGLTAVANQETKHTYNGASVIDVDFFGHDYDTDAGQGVYGVMFPGGGWRITDTTVAHDTVDTWTEAMLNKELWDALGLSVDPRCNIDIVATSNEAAGTGAAPLTLTVKYIL